MKLKKILNEIQSPIDLKKLENYAKAITTLCDGEYGQVYFSEDTNEVFVTLGDSSPFGEDLKEFMIDAIKKNYDVREDFKITIENEVLPPKNFKQIS